MIKKTAKTKLVALGAGAALALSLAACANSDNNAANNAGSSDAPQAETTSAAPEQTQAEATSYTPDQIEAALTAVKPELEGTTKILTADELSKSLDAAKQVAGQITTDPAECAGSEQMQAGFANANTTDIRILAESTGKVTLAGLSGDVVSDIADMMTQNKELASKCASYTVDVAGQSGTGTMEEIEVTIPNDKAFAVKSTTDFAGVPTATLNVNVVRGDTQIAATSTGLGATETPMSAEELQQLIDKTFAELEKQ
ncbi:hypothetical protein [Haematomicrobium sanguinis]|uniref:hypothetical protein n=1 Tax=Haematomicrobium sanguinis TaxID=479106 RepID=UPI00047E4ACD|nr:hypothetical protein [Haematomicrobium sanguinis]